MIDVAQQINAVRRKVGSRVFKAGEARVVTVSRTYNSTVEDVWDACTNPERIPRWFLPVSGELRLGGRYQLQGNAGGTVERCDPPKGFSATWEYDGNVSWIELRLTEAPEGGTRFELDHIIRVEDDARWAEFGPGAVGVGWELGFVALTRHLSTGEPVDPHEGMAWVGSEEGRRFVTLSSDGWYEAFVAAGEDPAVARAKADRTTAAYTGAGENG
ncbi:SRPBCC family protein [Streptomyces bluensis]|uniref:SRPBCC family protein n=1 Tax=Streptomyces bluensis TaxID=33897 RepID=UPI001679B1CB|nr:SRPBCC family protein [Streptomyces bluensis]GGZ77842.1 activator of HSP90 ATPase [Streptomyces bluensis]